MKRILKKHPFASRRLIAAKERKKRKKGEGKPQITQMSADSLFGNRLKPGGRIKTITDPAGLTTRHTYPSSTVTTVTHPNTSTTTTTLYKDGKISTVTGTAQPAKTYTYGYDTSGTYSGCLWTKEVTGSSTTNPWVKRYTDWLRRPAKTERPTFKNAGTLVHEYHYHNTTGQLTRGNLQERKRGCRGPWQGLLV